MFCIQVDNFNLYCGIKKRPSPVCSFMYMFTFLSLHVFSTVIFFKDISKTIYDRTFIFGIQVDKNKLYRGVENGLSYICSSLFLFFFVSLYIFLQRYLHNCVT